MGETQVPPLSPPRPLRSRSLGGRLDSPCCAAPGSGLRRGGGSAGPRVGVGVGPGQGAFLRPGREAAPAPAGDGQPSGGAGQPGGGGVPLGPGDPPCSGEILHPTGEGSARRGRGAPPAPGRGGELPPRPVGPSPWGGGRRDVGCAGRPWAESRLGRPPHPPRAVGGGAGKRRGRGRRMCVSRGQRRALGTAPPRRTPGRGGAWEGGGGPRRGGGGAGAGPPRWGLCPRGSHGCPPAHPTPPSPGDVLRAPPRPPPRAGVRGGGWTHARSPAAPAAV